MATKCYGRCYNKWVVVSNMDEEQKLLMKYMVELGAPMDCAIVTVGSLWKHSQFLQMFEYIIEHPEASYHELYLVANRIYARENKNAVCTRCGEKIGS